MNQSLREIKILPTITTTCGSDWRSKIDEIDQLKIEEIALFPTCLEKKERKELYRLLGKSRLKRVPYVHLKNDMDIEEIDYVVQNFGTEIFNVHTSREFPFFYDYSKYRDIIYIENVYFPLSEKEIENFAGVCLDFSHLENDRLLYKDKFERNVKIIEKFPIGCNHISAIKKEVYLDPESVHDKFSQRYDSHKFNELNEFDYLGKYPRKYFSFFIALELENSIKEQLTAVKYIKSIMEKLK